MAVADETVGGREPDGGERHPGGMSCAHPALVALVLLAACSSTGVPARAEPGPGRSGPIAGIACGFDGQPAAGITVRAVDADLAMVTEGVTTADGRFLLQATRPAHLLVARCEAVRQDLTLPAGDAPLPISFAHCPHVVVTGRLLDPAGAPASFVDIALRDAQRHTLALVTTDGIGAFEVRANEPVHELVVDPLGWAHRVPGPLAAAAHCEIDLRTQHHAFFRLYGRTLDAEGRPAAGVRVVAHGDERVVARTTSAVDGTFLLWSTQPIARLVGFDGPPVASRMGPWRADAQVDLDERAHGHRVVRGHIVGPHAARTAIYGVTARPQPPHRWPADGAAGTRGEFAVSVPRDQTHLWFFQEAGNREAYVPIVPGQDLVVRFER